MTSATVTSKGQITIPKDIRKLLGVSAGDRVEFVVGANGEVRIMPATIDIAELYGCLPKPKRPVTLEQMESAIAAGAGRKG